MHSLGYTFEMGRTVWFLLLIFQTIAASLIPLKEDDGEAELVRCVREIRALVPTNRTTINTRLEHPHGSFVDEMAKMMHEDTTQIHTQNYPYEFEDWDFALAIFDGPFAMYDLPVQITSKFLLLVYLGTQQVQRMRFDSIHVVLLDRDANFYTRGEFGEHCGENVDDWIKQDSCVGTHVIAPRDVVYKCPLQVHFSRYNWYRFDAVDSAGTALGRLQMRLLEETAKSWKESATISASQYNSPIHDLEIGSADQIDSTGFYPFFWDPYVVVVPPGGLAEWMELAQIFGTEVWVLLGVAVVMKEVLRSSPSCTRRFRMRRRVRACAVLVPPKLRMRITYICARLSAAIIWFALTSELTARLTNPPHTKALSSLQEINASDYTICPYRYRYFLRDPQHFQDFDIAYDCSDTFFNLSTFTSNVYLMKESDLDFIRSNYMVPKHEVVLLESLPVSILAPYFKYLRHPMEHQITHRMRAFIELGLEQKWARDMANPMMPDETRSLTLRHLYLPLIMLLTGYILATIAYCYERRTKKARQKRKIIQSS